MILLPPIFTNVFIHHITVEYPVPKGSLPPEDPKEVFLVGYARDAGLEAYVASVDGETRRSDGKLFHVTWSLESGRKPVESNMLLSKGFAKLEKLIPIYHVTGAILN